MDLENLSNRGSLLYKPNDKNPWIPGEGGSNSFELVFDGYSSNDTLDTGLSNDNGVRVDSIFSASTDYVF